MEKTREFSLIERYFAPLSAEAPGADGLKDDVATIPVSPGCVPVVTMDTLVAGIHFFPDDPPETVAKKLLRVNLSDLAASAADPVGYFLSLSLPGDIPESWIGSFAGGLRDDQDTFGISLFGGDTTSTSGPVSLALTAFGEAPESDVVRRSGARPGDSVFLTGTLGDAAIGLALINDLGFDDAMRTAPHPVSRYRVPHPRVETGPFLRGRASAAIDVSDGLLADAGHVCAASGVSMNVRLSAIPLSGETERIVAAAPDLMKTVLTGGDDYEILFCAAPENGGSIADSVKSLGISVAAIGEVTAGNDGVVIVDQDGKPLQFDEAGWQHF